MLPYEDIIDYSSFSVFFSEQELLDDPDTNIMDILDAMPSGEIKRLQENGRKVKKHFIYHDGVPEPGDAFDMFVSDWSLIHCVALLTSLAGSPTRTSESQQPKIEEHAPEGVSQDSFVLVVRKCSSSGAN